MSSPNPMLIYTTARKSYWPYILKQWSIPAAILFVIITYDRLFASDLINITDSFYWIGAGLLLYRFVDLVSRSRIYKIVLDEDAKTITQYSRSVFSGGGEKIYTLSKMQLYIKSKSAASAPEVITRSLILYKDRREALLLDTKKDGFAPQTLHEIRQVLEQLGVPVTE